MSKYRLAKEFSTITLGDIGFDVDQTDHGDTLNDCLQRYEIEVGKLKSTGKIVVLKIGPDDIRKGVPLEHADITDIVGSSLWAVKADEVWLMWGNKLKTLKSNQGLDVGEIMEV